MSPASLDADADGCPACGASATVPWAVWPDDLAACAECGLVFSATLVTKPDASRERNVAAFATFAITRWSTFFSRWKARRLVARLAQHVRAGRVLEVGPGDGEFLQALRRRGFHVEGLDLSPKICEALRDRLGVPMHCGEIGNVTHSSHFDVVAGHHVIEHVRDPAAFLRGARTLLGRPGILFLTCPNVRSPAARIPGWVGYQPYHVCYFSPARLARLVVEAGFEVLYLGTREPPGAFWDTLYRQVILRTNPMASPAQRSAEGTPVGTRALGVGNVVKVIASVLHAPIGSVLGVLGRGDEIVLIGRAP